MEIILLEKIRNLGDLGARVKVKRGYGRNYLIPYGRAVYATEENVSKFEKRRAELEKIAAERQQQALVRKQQLEALGVITVAAKAGEEGKLFGSIGTRDIAEALVKAGATIEKREIQLPTGAIRMLGEYEISVELYSDVIATVKVLVASEGTSA